MGYAAWATMDNAKEMRASVDDLIAVSDDDPNTVAVLTDANGNFFQKRNWRTVPISIDAIET